jgi:hypothetical protein
MAVSADLLRQRRFLDADGIGAAARAFASLDPNRTLASGIGESVRQAKQHSLAHAYSSGALARPQANLIALGGTAAMLEKLDTGSLLHRRLSAGVSISHLLSAQQDRLKAALEVASPTLSRDRYLAGTAASLAAGNSIAGRLSTSADLFKLSKIWHKNLPTSFTRWNLASLAVDQLHQSLSAAQYLARDADVTAPPLEEERDLLVTLRRLTPRQLRLLRPALAAALAALIHLFAVIEASREAELASVLVDFLYMLLIVYWTVQELTGDHDDT